MENTNLQEQAQTVEVKQQESFILSQQKNPHHEGSRQVQMSQIHNQRALNMRKNFQPLNLSSKLSYSAKNSMQQIIFTNQDIQKAQMFDKYNKIKAMNNNMNNETSHQGKTGAGSSAIGSTPGELSNQRVISESDPVTSKTLNVNPGTINENEHSRVSGVFHNGLYVEGINGRGQSMSKIGFQTNYDRFGRVMTNNDPRGGQSFTREESPLMKYKRSINPGGTDAIQTTATQSINHPFNSLYANSSMRNGEYDAQNFKSSNYVVKMTTKSAYKNPMSGMSKIQRLAPQKAQSVIRQYTSQVYNRKISSSQRDRDEIKQRRFEQSVEDLGKAKTILPDMTYQSGYRNTIGVDQVRNGTSLQNSNSKYRNNNFNEQAKRIIKKISQRNGKEESLDSLSENQVHRDSKNVSIFNENHADFSRQMPRKASLEQNRLHKNVYSSEATTRKKRFEPMNPNNIFSNDAMISPVNRSQQDFGIQSRNDQLNFRSQKSLLVSTSFYQQFTQRYVEQQSLELQHCKSRIASLEHEMYMQDEELLKMKQINKDLLDQLSQNQIMNLSDNHINSNNNNTQSMEAVLKNSQNNADATKIHSLYQDLYLTDLKKDLNVVEYELKNQKFMYQEKVRDTTSLKKEIIQYQCSLKRYRRMVQELQNKLSKLTSSQNQQQNNNGNKKDNLFQYSEDLAHQPSFDNTSQASFQDKKNSTLGNMSQKQDASPRNKNVSSMGQVKAPLNVNTMDLQKMEKLQLLMANLVKTKKVFKAFISVLFDLKNCVNCSIVTLFLFDTKISDHQIKDYCFMQKTMIDGRWVDRIGINEKDVSEPGFKKFEDLQKIVRTQEYLAFPVFNRNGDLIAGIQVEARIKQATGKHMGFYLIDELVMKIVLSNFQMKLDKLIAEQEIKAREKEVISTISLASSICTQRSYRDLFRQMKTAIPIFFEFESIGILLRDLKTQELFTIAESYDLTGIEQRGDEFKNTTIIRFPSSLGVTGYVYNSGELYICNKAQKDSKFSSDIDNLGATGDVHNFMIGPIYGHKDTKNKELPIGIIQFTNKKDFKVINDYDKKKFHAIQNLIGLSIDNTSEIHSTMNITIAVRDAFVNLERMLFDSFNDDKSIGLDNSIDNKFEKMNELLNKISDIKRQIYF